MKIKYHCKDPDWFKPYEKRASHCLYNSKQFRDYFDYVSSLMDRFPRIRNLIVTADKECAKEISREYQAALSASKKRVVEGVKALNLKQRQKEDDLKKDRDLKVNAINSKIRELKDEIRLTDENFQKGIVALMDETESVFLREALPLAEEYASLGEEWGRENVERLVAYRRTAIQRVFDHYNWKKPGVPEKPKVEE